MDKKKSTFWGEAPAFAGLVDIARDKGMEEALRQVREISISLLENAAEVITIVEADGVINFINRDIPGVTRQELIGRSMYEFVSPQYHARMRKAVKKSFETGTHSKFKIKAPLTVDSPWWFSTRVSPVRLEDQTIAVCCMIRNITRRVEAEAALKKAQEELELKVEQRTESLEEMNAALKVLLKRRDEDKKEFEGKVLLNMKDLAEPYLEKLKASGLKERQRSYLDVLEANLKDITSPFLYKYSLQFAKLTPAEIRVANLVKHGKTTKEISEFLNLSFRTIDNHRRNIREKLGLRNKKANLRSHMLTIQ